MNAEMTSHLSNSFLTFDCLQSNFGFELDTVLLAFVLAHLLLLAWVSRLELIHPSSFLIPLHSSMLAAAVSRFFTIGGEATFYELGFSQLSLFCPALTEEWS